MYKGIKWLKEAIGELDLVDTVFDVGGVSYIDTAVRVMQVYDLIDQLDEPEVLSQKWIDEHIDYADVGGDTSVYTCISLKSLLVPKRELPVVPKHVGDWITNYREKYDLYPALRLLENNTLVWGSIYEWYRMNTHKFVNAYLTGEYEVEEVPKYNVQLKARSSIEMVGVFLYKQGDEVLAGDNFKAYLPEKDEFRLTEQEIKDFDEKFWSFAKPVE